MLRIFSLFLVFISVLSATAQQKVDLLVYNAKIYTVDQAFTIAEALAVDKGIIVDVGSTTVIRKKYQSQKNIDAKGKYIFPGFIDAHSHFIQYGFTLERADLVGTTSWNEVLRKIRSFAATHKEGWLQGHGWDQNDWPVEEFPDNQKLNELFPDRPVVLTRIDGHAIIANKTALEICGVKAGDTIAGGQIQVKNGRLTGIMIDNATSIIYSHIPSHTLSQYRHAIIAAQENCFAAGLTTVEDCGINYREVQLLDEMQKSSDLKMRIFAMLSDRKENFDFLFANVKIKTPRLNVRSFKLYADGALGSRGACLLQPYSDKPGWTGFLLSPVKHFDSVAALMIEKGFQLCTHAIGDSGNRMILNIYAKYLKGKNDLRWRIEHAQVVNQNDFHLFGDYNIVPSVQPTHATSDMYWAGQRLGTNRLKGAYAYNDLLKQNGWIPLGTDFPVEDISPIKTFYAAVFRKDAKGWPTNGFQSENALSRQDALRGITIWAAKGNFEEEEKGSLEKGKVADFVVLDKDLMSTDAKNVFQTKVLRTFVNGEQVYGGR